MWRRTPLAQPALPWQIIISKKIVHELNVASARLGREAADECDAKDPSRPRFVAGAIGPTNRTASLSPDVNDPALRNVTFDQLVMRTTHRLSHLLKVGRLSYAGNHL